jgi:arginine repressor
MEAYEECGGNVTAIERYLRERGISSSRATIAKMMDHLGLPRIKKPRD